MGTGSGHSFAERLNGNYFLKTQGTGATVFSDGTSNLVQGASGKDWVVK
jgi:hypothetical protein